jgi:hypothetical protein
VVRPNFWIDKKVERERAASTQLTQRDRVEGGTVTEQVDATHIAVRLDGSELPDVVAPSESGVSAVGAWVRAIRDSTGRIAKFGIPDSIPSGAEQFSVGVTGERLVQLDATTAAQGAQLDVARGDLDAARARLDDPETGLDATQAKAQQAVDDAASAVTKAGSAADAASTAQNTADAKARTFTATPTAPYQVGDLWRNGNKVYVCTTARASGSYTAADWALTADKTSENTAADTSKVGGTSAATVIQNIQTALANGKPFVQQATPSATAVGQLWFPTDADGHVIGMKVSTATGTGAWQDYTIVAGEILVPGSVGTTEIGPDGVTAPNVKVSDELWAKFASFVKITTDMLIAGNATITNELLVNELVGKVITGATINGGEIWMRGSDPGAATQGIYTDFSAPTSLDPFLVTSNSGGTLTRVAEGQSGYCAKITAPAGGWVDLMGRTTTDISAWNLSACPWDGVSEVHMKVKSDQDTNLVLLAGFENAEWDATKVLRGWNLQAGVWTDIYVAGPEGYRLGRNIKNTLASVCLYDPKIYDTSGSPTFPATTVRIDSFSWVNQISTASAVHIWRDEGVPKVDVLDHTGVVRASLSAPISGKAGLSFFSDEGDAMTFTGSGLSLTHGPTTVQIASWAAVQKVVADGGWIDLSPYLVSGVTGTLKGRKIGGAVYLAGFLQGFSLANMATTPLAQLPAEWRPSSAYEYVSGTSTYFSGIIRLESGGSLNFQNLESSTATRSTFSMTPFVQD